MDSPLSTNSYKYDDIHFVSSSSHPNADIDIIIVDDHSGNSRDTWAESKSLYERLCHLYLEELKNTKSRILVFDYCAVAHPSWNGLQGDQRNVSEQAQQLLDLILEQRSTWRTSYRPIIFITHGLGGMLVEEALRLSIESGFRRPNWTQRTSLITHSAYGLFLFSDKRSLGWKPYDWDRVTPKELRPIECSRMDINLQNTLSKLYCNHHESIQLPSLAQLTRSVAIFSSLLAQAFFIVVAIMLVEERKAREWIIFGFAPYILYVVMSYILSLRDRYQRHFVALGLLIGSIPSTYLIMTGTDFDVISIILAAFVTFSIGFSTFIHWYLPNRLVNEEWKAFHAIKNWAENPALNIEER